MRCRSYSRSRGLTMAQELSSTNWQELIGYSNSAKIFGGKTDAAEKTRIRASLLEYCKRDTLALLEIRKILLQKTFEPRDQNLTPV